MADEPTLFDSVPPGSQGLASRPAPAQREAPAAPQRVRPTWLHGRSSASGGATAPHRALWAGRCCVGVLTLALLALLGRVAQLQAEPDARVAALLEAHTSERTIMARRGALLDRRGRLLAGARVGQRLFVDPQLIDHHSMFPERLAYALDYEPVRIAQLIGENIERRYVVIDHRLDDERAARVRELDLSAVATEPVLVRDYPQDTLAGQVIGFTGRDGDGLAGLEAAFDDVLRPKPGRVGYLRDARRRTLWMRPESQQPHEDGRPVRLALDATIQHHAEQALAEAVESFDAAHGQMVVMDPRTGEVLAMANYPFFDPNAFASAAPEMRRNRSVTDVFEPGSIFKPFIWAVATQNGAARPTEMIDTTESGVYYTRGRRLRDARPHGLITWEQVLIYSSNIGMAKVGERLGIEKLHRAVKMFGFGEPTGSELPGEVGGLVRPASQWTHYSLTSIPMGQEVSVTPLQITRAFCALANGGLLVAPTMRVVDGNQVLPIQQRVLRPATAERTRQVMRRVVTEGGGRRAQSSMYTIFGKTGTAQLPDFERGGYHQDRYVSSFVGGAPLDKPRLVVGCFVHDPNRSKDHFGGTVAAPAVKQVLEQSLRYLGVPRDVEADGV
ncbi:MAG: peptidoglycan D,D-transpeptidase FtsI family protein [Phycisphaeraceae bacterium]